MIAVPPVVEVVDSAVIFRAGEEATIRVTASDSDGTVEKYIWKVSGASEWDTTEVPEYRFSYKKGGIAAVTVGAIDNDGCMGYTEAEVLFNRPPESISMKYPSNDKRYIFDEVDFSDTIGTIIAFGLKATDPDGENDSL